VPEQVQTVIGEDVSERLDVTPAKFRVIVTRRPKYAYRDRDGVIQAPAPSHLIESGLARAEGRSAENHFPRSAIQSSPSRYFPAYA